MRIPEELHRSPKPDSRQDLLLDDMADMAEHWKKNRENGRTPKHIKAAMLSLARSLTQSRQKAE